jgi:hypothetical protein
MELLATVLWKSSAETGLEYLSLLRTTAGFRAEGTVLRVADETPLNVQYTVTCDAAWQTRQVYVSLQSSAEQAEHHYRVDARQRWWHRGRELTHLRGCVDVDLGITPFTNSLPIRRFRLEVGQSRELTAAWLRFPDLVIKTMGQRYTRLAADRYLYENTDGSFSAELTVDDLGLVVTYAGGWERIA